MEKHKNPLQSQLTRSKYLIGSSLKGLSVLLLTLCLLLVTSCLNGQLELPTFSKNDFKQTDIIPNDTVEEIIHLYGKGKINTLAFQVGVRSYEESFYSQMNHIKQMTPSFFLEMELIFRDLYSLTKTFNDNEIDQRNYLKNTLLRLCDIMLSDMSPAQTSEILSIFYEQLDVKSKNFLFDYSLSIAEHLFSSLEVVYESKVSLSDMELIRTNISKTGTPFKRKDIKLGLRSSFQRIEKVTFLLDERVTDVELLKREIRNGRNLFVSNDSSFDLLTAIRKVKNNPWLSEIDYPYVLGNGYVEVFPAESYRVRQYGRFKGKSYVFSDDLIKYKNNESYWIDGSYKLENSSMKILIGRYETEVEVFRVNDDTYLLDSEILLKE